MTAYRAFGFAVLSATWTASPRRSEGRPLVRASLTIHFWKFCTASQYSVGLNSLRDVDAKQHQFSPQRVRHSFKTKCGGAISTEKRDSHFGAVGGRFCDEPPIGRCGRVAETRHDREAFSYGQRRCSHERRRKAGPHGLFDHRRTRERRVRRVRSFTGALASAGVHGKRR
jgi:hypothetical protein